MGVTKPCCTWVFNTWFLGRPEIVDFWGLGGPGGPKNHSKRWGASPPTFWNGLWGRWGRPEVHSPAYGWSDFREDQMIYQAPGFWPIFGPLGAHGGPREPRERPQLDK